MMVKNKDLTITMPVTLPNEMFPELIDRAMRLEIGDVMIAVFEQWGIAVRIQSLEGGFVLHHIDHPVIFVSADKAVEK